jgi:hypothetical protein
MTGSQMTSQMTTGPMTTVQMTTGQMTTGQMTNFNHTCKYLIVCLHKNIMKLLPSLIPPPGVFNFVDTNMDKLQLAGQNLG